MLQQLDNTQDREIQVYSFKLSEAGLKGKDGGLTASITVDKAVLDNVIYGC
jgi:hypothetical protein